MIDQSIRKAALALVPLSVEDQKAAIRVARAVAKIPSAARAAALRAASLLGGEVKARRKRGEKGDAPKVTRRRKAPSVEIADVA